MKYPYEHCGTPDLIELDDEGNPIEAEVTQPEREPPPEPDDN
jgi:hypothetical protein